MLYVILSHLICEAADIYWTTCNCVLGDHTDKLVSGFMQKSSLVTDVIINSRELQRSADVEM